MENNNNNNKLFVVVAPDPFLEEILNNLDCCPCNSSDTLCRTCFEEETQRAIDRLNGNS
jgi:hypothetical protein